MIVIMGESGSGKTSIERELVHMGLKRIISYTSRQPREGEVDGIDYYYVTQKSFNNLAKIGFFAENISYRGNSYGVAKIDCDPEAIAVVEPGGYKQLQETIPERIEAFYLDVPEETRAIRMLQRGDKYDSVHDRIITDREHFKGLKGWVKNIVQNGSSCSAKETAKYIMEVVNSVK
jgi:guanylate kinase